MSALQIPPGDNVVPFPSPRRPTTPNTTGNPWRALTHDLVMAKARRGDLDPAVVAYLLEGVGLGGRS